LKLFSERLQDIPRKQILSCPIPVISGVEEMRLIYHHVAHTTGGPDRRLVVDIGGGGTEWVTGR